jgi:tRNA(Arg) A34 adenosine deaminase TadA
MLTNTKYNIYEKCLNEANKSMLRYRHGCIATYGGKIIKKGFNTSKYDKNTCTCHAEVNVLNNLYNSYCRKQQKIKILRILSKTTLYICRLTQGGFSDDSAPCFDCLNLINKYNIKKIIFCLNHEYYVINPKNYKTPTFSDGHNYVKLITNKTLYQ